MLKCSGRGPLVSHDPLMTVCVDGRGLLVSHDPPHMLQYMSLTGTIHYWSLVVASGAEGIRNQMHHSTTRPLNCSYGFGEPSALVHRER